MSSDEDKSTHQNKKAKTENAPISEEEAEERRMKMLMKQQNIWFYNFGQIGEDKIQRSKNKPSDFQGEYDIIYHYGDCDDGEIQNRTSKGKVAIGETDGIVEFDKAIKFKPHFLYQSDFKLSNLVADEKYEFWKCNCEAMLIDEDARGHIHEDDDPMSGNIIQIKERIACGLLKEEDGDDSDIKFNSIEEAEKLNDDHSKKYLFESSWLVGHKGLPQDVATSIHRLNERNAPKPVFFLEPGDLLLHVDWSDDFREPAWTECVLRKRTSA